MGGKSKILDPKQLEMLYVESRKFSQKSADLVEKIVTELKKLQTPEFQDNLSGGQGEAAKAAIASVAQAVEQLKETIDKTSKFINSKLEGSQQLARDKNGFGESSDKSRNIGNNMNLRK